jgi:Ca-activated chloride channel family protein
VASRGWFNLAGDCTDGEKYLWDAFAMKQEWIFAVNEWLYTLPWLATGGLSLWLLSRRIARRRLEKFVALRLFATAMPSVNRRGKLIKFIAGVAAAMLIVLALARPLNGPRPDRVEGKGFDLVIALDVSKSMCVEDVDPNRLAAVKKELSGWLKQLSGERVGLVLFAGDAFVQAPLTFDYPALDYVLQQAGPKAVSLGGTNIAKGIEASAGLLEKCDAGSRFLLIISDGENLDGDAMTAAGVAHSEKGIKIFTMGVGTLTGGKVPIEDYSIPRKDGKPPKKYYINNEYGYQVTSRLDSRTLRSLASAGGGQYYEFKSGSQTIQALRDQSLLPLARKNRVSDVNDYYEWFRLPLAIAIILLAVRQLTPDYRNPEEERKTGVDTVRPTTYSLGRIITVIMMLSLLPAVLLANVTDRVDELLASGKKDEAVQLMSEAVRQNEQDNLLFYNYALTLYRVGRYDEAINAFRTLQQNLNDRELQDKASFQIGNAQIQLGEELEKRGALAGAILSYERSTACFEESMANIGSAARNNREFSLWRLEVVLLKSGEDSVKVANDAKTHNNLTGEENRLRMALQAYERVTEINPSNKDAADRVKALRERLWQNLVAQASLAASQADQLQAEAKSKPDDVLNKRQQSVTKYNEALQLLPEKNEIAKAKQEQMNKMSDFITDKVEPEVSKIMEKPQLSFGDGGKLQQAREKLEQAMTLNPDNERAKDLNAKVTSKLEQFYAESGQKSLENMEKSKNVSSKLTHANEAADKFGKAMELNSENKTTKDGMSAVQKQLPDLLAAAAENDVKAAQAANGDSTKDLQKKVGFLEKAESGLGKAEMLNGSREDIKQRARDVRQMLSNARDRLNDKLNAELQPNSGNKGDSDAENETKPENEMQSMSDLRGKPKKAIEKDNFWNRKIRDW